MKSLKPLKLNGIKMKNMILICLLISATSLVSYSQEFVITTEPIYNYTVDRYTSEIYYKQNYPNQRDVHKTNFDGSDNIKTNFQSTPFFANNSHKAVILEWTGNDEISYFLFNFETMKKKYLFKTHSRMYLVDISFSWDDSLLYVYNEPLIYYSFNDSTLHIEKTIIEADGVHSHIIWHKDNDRLFFINYDYIGSYSIMNSKFDTLVVIDNYDSDNGYDRLYCYTYNSKTDLLAYGYGRDSTYWLTSIYELDMNSGIKKELISGYSDKSLGTIREMSWNKEGNLLAFTNVTYLYPKIQDLHLYNYSKDTTYLYQKDVWQTRGGNWLDSNKIAFINSGLSGYKFDEPLTVEKIETKSYIINLTSYPNPFNSEASIEFTVPCKGNVCLVIYNILGQEITTLLNEYKEKGSYRIKWSGVDKLNETISTGVYIVRLNIKEGNNITYNKYLKILNIK